MQTRRPPGFVGVRDDPDVLMMLCTAGHVDHGKTELVRILTGCRTDKLRDEIERGLTIELGFAPCSLGNGLGVGIVDVPGHERFVRTMVAGVSGIGMAILVIAADDGIMPQTIEHLQIMQLMGVPRGLVALSKIDLVDGETIVSRTEAIRQLTLGTFLQDCPVCPVSSRTGDGFPAFYATLVATVRQSQCERRGGIFRLPVERSFSPPGAGTVITGIPLAGSVRVGDELELVPTGLRGRVRNVQRFLNDADEGRSGQCLALNMPDINGAQVQRGQALCIPGYLQASTILHGSLQCLGPPRSPPRHGERVHLHSGTTEVLADLYVLEERPAPDPWLVSLVTVDPVPVAAGDRFILRRPSPAMTFAGGGILMVEAGSRRPRRKRILERLHEVEQFEVRHAALASDARKVLWYTTRGPAEALSAATVSRETLVPVDRVEELLSAEADAHHIVGLGRDRFVGREIWERLRDRLSAHIQGVATQGKMSIPSGELRRVFSVSGILWDHLLADLETRGIVTSREGDLVISATTQRAIVDDPNAARIRRIYEQTGFEPPRPEEVAKLLQVDTAAVDQAIAAWAKTNTLVRLGNTVVLSHTCVLKARDLVVDIIQRDGTLDSGDFKRHITSSRKVALAILDYLDARGVTIRTGNRRRLAVDWAKKRV